MSRRFLSSTLIVALAMAFMLAWTAHAYSLAVPPRASAQDAVALKHGHDNSEVSSGCSHCADHYHAPLTPDHQHETPQLSSAAQLIATFGPPVPLAWSGDPVPHPPIFRIERPPRPAFMC
ncbi:hypothetical protein CC207_21635 [Pseudomonas sp. DrBHI1]|nr:hypothetical protein CC207_21635 [Pseudomonas sp. DrBHI1]